MLNEFWTDLEAAKAAERIALEELSKYYDGWSLEDVSEDRSCYYLGDLKATSATGAVNYIEVKDDSVIYKTKNVLCEDEVYYKEGGYFGQGNMHNGGDLYCIVSQPERKIYLIDYARLREIYKKGEFKMINHPKQYSNCYLLELCRVKQWGALIDVIKY